MASISNHSLFVTCLSTTHKLLAKHVQLKLHFENSYREHLCDFNFEQYISMNCQISLSKMIDALKNACIDTRQYIGEQLERGVDSSLHNIYSSIYHQIWTPFASATLAQLAKQSQTTVKQIKGKMVTSTQEAKVLPKLPKKQADTMCRELEELAATASPLYPKLCTKENCAACRELLFDLPLSKCSVDCPHKKLSLGMYPHLSRKFMEKIKPHHGQSPVKVRLQYKPDTYENPLYEVEIPSQNVPTIEEVEQGVDRIELASTTTAATLDLPIEHGGKQPSASVYDGDAQSRTKSWVEMASEDNGDLKSVTSTPRPVSRKRASESVNGEDVEQRIASPRKQPLRRSPRTAAKQ